MNKYDSIIIGGGCSGLSLAIQLAKKDPEKRHLILENRSIYHHDRTWSFWDVDSHPFENQIQHTWGQWKVRHRGRDLILSSARYRYCSIPSDNFYKEAISQINRLPNVHLMMGKHVQSLLETSSHVTIETNQGEYTCSKVFDSRPEKTPSCLYQHFLGWEILSEHPHFDPLTVTLMDFDVDQSKGLHFMYVLPFSQQSALIESTFISPHPHHEQIYEEAIYKYLKDRFKTTHYHIVRKERGILPLTTALPTLMSDQVIPIGAKAGWTRASTGYAFLPIQRAIQNLISDQKMPSSLKTDLYLDQIFLGYLNEHPQLAPELFFNLFNKNSPDTIVRFLTGHWTSYDLLKVVFSMPKMAMIKQALHLKNGEEV